MPKQKLVLAEGEVTGHAHVIEVDEAKVDKWSSYKEFSINEERTVKHEEHKPVTIPPGEYCSDQILEYDYDREEARRISD